MPRQKQNSRVAMQNPNQHWNNLKFRTSTFDYSGLFEMKSFGLNAMQTPGKSSEENLHNGLFQDKDPRQSDNFMNKSDT